MNVLNRTMVYENAMPQLRSRQSIFPFPCELPRGAILACYQLGEAFESVDCTSFCSISNDGGKSFFPQGAMFGGGQGLSMHSDSCKITLLPDGRLAALGYAFDRSDTSLPVGNPQTGGLLDDVVFISYSHDDGASWSRWQYITCNWGPHIEASAPLTVLQSGAWVTPITGFPQWDGGSTGRNCGRLLRSDDLGATWTDNAVCMAFEGDETTCYEQRLTQLQSGKIVCIGWNENIRTGERLNNHFTVSHDDGRTFSAPMPTGIQGQASSVCAIGGERLLALHAVRRDTQRPGIYAYIVDISENTWNIQEELLLWEPAAPLTKDKNMAEIFSFLKFGQPGAILLRNGDAFITHWAQENGQYNTFATLLSL